MKFAPVLPASMYALVDDGDYHFVHAGLLVEDPVAAGIIEGWCRGSIDLVMLTDDDPDVLLKVATYLTPDEIVCPYAVNDAQETITLAYDYLKDCADAAKRVMIVPQGESVEEWVDCYHSLLDAVLNAHIIVTIGVTRELRNRYAALAYLESRLDSDVRHHRVSGVHLIGGDGSFRDLVELARLFHCVRGCSAVWPYANAFYGCTLDRWDGGAYLSILPRPAVHEMTDDMWTPAIVAPQLITRTVINIAVCRHRIKEIEHGS